ncbi:MULTISPECIES: GNAT family N-acetyltransferase [Sinorhizobium]|uniref:Acetyltransferase n=2 Tax=Sinorhizobium TaxID=28105 RepID=A0A2S3YS57_9HYPH|nr:MULTISPECIES: GNAT family N-acetyltransferase [Sinorhizobium]AUX80166.1 GCN5-related N-acetyltransferase protein [Sinorhizobium fredii]PDT43454.1 GNAT family N-acetyltransferase [Sinorhizobium sp. FG01]POH34454.1 acetyltransferase [Sinorhizobium americanum]
MTVAIRLLGPDEVGTFRRIRLEALRTEPDSFASSAADWEKLPDEEWRRRLTDNPVFVAFRGGEPVGIMGLLRQSASMMAHRATVVMVYVHRSLRGSDAAGLLLAAVTDHARHQGIRQLELSVSAENAAAIAFYRRERFEAVGRIPGGCIRNGREVDDIIMVRRIVD